MINFEACHHYKHMQNNTEAFSIGPSAGSGNGGVGLTSQMISKYAVPALKGFVRSITLSKGSSLQDTLRQAFFGGTQLTLEFYRNWEFRRSVLWGGKILEFAGNSTVFWEKILEVFFLLHEKYPKLRFYELIDLKFWICNATVQMTKQ